jgi:hypothetical protein
LAKFLGDDVAMQVYRALLAHTGMVAAQWTGPVRVFVAGDVNQLHDSKLGAFALTSQSDGNLGQRLMAGVSETLKTSPHGVVAIGTDCPRLQIHHLTTLMTGLQHAPVAIGPARDGGYWGIAVNTLAAAKVCFAKDLPWSEQTLMVATRKRLSAAGIPCGHGELLNDLDTVADLNRAEAAGFRWSDQGTT